MVDSLISDSTIVVLVVSILFTCVCVCECEIGKNNTVGSDKRLPRHYAMPVPIRTLKINLFWRVTKIWRKNYLNALVPKACDTYMGTMDVAKIHWDCQSGHV